METLNLAEQKLLIFQKIMSINNQNKINKLYTIVDKLSNENDIDLSFEEWNDLFMEDTDLTKFIPEYDMTVGELRKKIYDAETSKNIPINQFINKLKNYV